jgi:hypothetical protein
MCGISSQRKGVTILGEKHSAINDLSDHFDLITAFDLIEHLEDPFAFMQAMTERTKEGAYIVISSGNSNSWPCRLEGGNYWYVRIPEHISFINSAWCQYAAERLNLRICQMVPFSHGMNKTLSCILKESSLNILFMMSPEFYKAIVRLRYRLIGDMILEESSISTPYWGTSCDHLFVIFRKGTSK